MSPKSLTPGGVAAMDVTEQVAGMSASSSDPSGLQVAAETPVTASLRREVAQMKDQLVFTGVEAESFAKNVKVDAMENARHFLLTKGQASNELLSNSKSSPRTKAKNKSLMQKQKLLVKLFQPFGRKMIC